MPKYIIIRLQAGLGNQMYQYALGKALAVKMNRKIYIDPRPILNDISARNYELNIFLIDSKILKGYKKWCTRWVASVTFGKLFKILNPLTLFYKVIRDAERGYDPSIFQPNIGTIIIQGYWQSYKYFENIKDQIRYDFRFKSNPNEENKKWINEISSQENAVNIHIRRGDYVNNPLANQLHGTCNLNYYYNAIELIEKKVTNPTFYIFTDDPRWARENLKLTSPLKIIDHNLGKNDYEDLRLMTYCKHHIIANSSFSWWGAWLATDQEKIVVAPKKWFNIDNMPAEDRIPQNWIRI